MPSFDLVCELDRQELKNALDQVQREIKQRYDFRDSKSSIKEEGDTLLFISDDDFRMTALIDVFQNKVIKRSLSLKSFEFGKIEPGAGDTVKSTVKLVEGIDKEKAKDLVKKIKDLKLKVQAAIQDNQIRVTGKKRDDLQEVIAAIKGFDYPLPLNFENFRD
jgi:cyclic-di-GMP-binding protein